LLPGYAQAHKPIVAVSLELYSGKRVSLVVSDGKTAGVSKKLAPNFVILDARETIGLPAEVWLDGKKLGIAPDMFTVLAGDHELRVVATLNGQQVENTRKVTVAEGKEQTAEVGLKATVTAPTASSTAYPIGSRGPAGGIIFYDKGNYIDG